MVIPKTITAKTTTTVYHMDTFFVTSKVPHVCMWYIVVILGSVINFLSMHTLCVCGIVH